MVAVREVADDHLLLERLVTVPPTREAARAFGARLAATHAAGAPAFGSPPHGWDGDGFLGPLSEPLPLGLRPEPRWGVFWAEQRIAPMARLARDRGALDPGQAAACQAAARRAADGELDPGEPPARIHGDLWSGNVMWTPTGVVLIDPAAHGGHRETDLAMLVLFGCPHLDDVVAAYDDVAPPAPGRDERRGLHTLHPLLVHAALFGGGYGARAAAEARAYA